MSRRRRIGIVVQRYGEEIIGGAESHARMIAERLAATGDYEVEVYTTTSREISWDDVFPVGVSALNGVTLRRFRTETPRAPWFRLLHQVAKAKNHRMVGRLVPKRAAEAFETLWYKAQGPYCPTLVAALAEGGERCDRFLFFTYLYYPTVFGLPQVASRALLVPTVHDEPALYNERTRRLLSAARRILVNTDVERELIVGLEPSLAAKTSIAGVGIEVPPQQRTPRLASIPYGLYLGRIGRAKRVDGLIAAYQELRRAGKASWDLYLVGARDGDVAVEGLPGVRYLGQVDEASKWRLISEAAFVVNPSEHESLSLATLEALAASRPVLLSRACPVFRRYAEEVSAVFLYGSAAELASGAGAALEVSVEQLERARSWVLARHGWARILATYADALESV
jgi:glycosyltransferase involved in cell wall biosynthesis